MEERLQKILARVGIASRRKAEELITEGRVTVNGATAVIGTKADPEHDHIKLDGKRIRVQPFVYYKMYKPYGVVTTMHDPEGRPSVGDLLREIRFRVYPVGRLDYDAEGLLLITNDGDLTKKLTHPSHEVRKKYVVKIRGIIDEESLKKIRYGITLDDGPTAPARARKIRETEGNCWIEVTIHEGRNRQVRRMLERFGFTVLKLRRVEIGGVTLGDLGPAEIVPLTPEELQLLRERTEKAPQARKSALSASRPGRVRSRKQGQ